MFCLFAGNIGEKNSKWSWGGNGSWVRLQLPRPSVPEMTEGTCRNPSCSVWSELHRALHSATAWKRELFFFFPLSKKFSGSLGEGRYRFFFVIMGPFVEMREERAACLRCAGFAVIPRAASLGY